MTLPSTTPLAARHISARIVAGISLSRIKSPSVIFSLHQSCTKRAGSCQKIPVVSLGRTLQNVQTRYRVCSSARRFDLRHNEGQDQNVLSRKSI